MKEYFFFKIAAALGFGPRMENIFGYDLVCYNDRIEFAMELCEMNLAEEDTHFTADLLEGLKKMHKLKMVHRDIKRKNIGWSHHFQRWVFLDFGFATILEEKIGEKSMSQFIGTYKNVVP